MPAFRGQEEVRLTPRPSTSFGEKTPLRGLPASLLNWGDGRGGSRNRIEGAAQLKFFLEKNEHLRGWG